jgi:hypothetical protein
VSGDIRATAGPSRAGVTIRADIVSITFQSDHQKSDGSKLLQRADPVTLHVQLDGGGLRDYVSTLGDNTVALLKPEWDAARGGNDDIHPTSQTRGTNVVIDVKMKFSISPSSRPLQLKSVWGAAEERMVFKARPRTRIRDGAVVTLRMTSESPLPDNVAIMKFSLAWFFDTDVGTMLPLGFTGPHIIYVTLATPGGVLDSPTDNNFAETGPAQAITETRLAYACRAANGRGGPGVASRDKDCCDAIFMRMLRDQVGYFLGRRWEHALDNTGVSPKPTLHHYLWLCVFFKESRVVGECHNIGAAMVLACRILGITDGTFHVGYMYPWSRRSATPPAFAPLPPPAWLGRYNERCIRAHRVTEISSSEDDSFKHGPDNENLCFLDGNNKANNFEGVAKYDWSGGMALYAIGDAIFDARTVAHDNASDYFAKRGNTDSTGHLTNGDRTKGWAKLKFFGAGGGVLSRNVCRKPYPFCNDRSYFHWEE